MKPPAPLSASAFDRTARGGAWPLALAVVAGWLPTLAAAQAVADPPAQASLATVEIKGQALLQSGNTPATRTSFDALTIRELGLSQPEQLLGRVPGMRVMTYGLGGVASAIALRGFGGGAHGGDLGFVLDGINLNEAISHADGYADLNVVIPLELQRVDVVKGPSTTLVGNYNRAGTVFLQTRRGGSYQLADVSAGSFRTVDTQLAGGWRLGAGQLNAAAQLFTTRDFRPGSGFERATVAGRWSVPLAGGELALSARVHRGDWDSASYLPLAQLAAAGPRGRDPRVLDDGGDKTFDTLRIEATRQLVPDVKLLAYAYGTHQTFTRFFTRPVGAAAWRQRDETYERTVAGAGFSLNGAGTAWGRPLKWLAGAETTREATDFDFYDGTTRRARVALPVARQDRRYRFDSTGAFAEAELAVAPWLRPTVGLRWDGYTGRCDTRGPETVGAGDPPCDRPLNRITHLSPKLGVRSTVAPGVDLRVSRNEGFQLANVRGLFAPGNQAGPNVFTQHELGARIGPFGDVSVDVAVWRLDSDNEIRELPAGSGVFVNSGQTRRSGADVSVQWEVAAGWEATLAYGLAKGVVQAHPNAALVGRRLNGVPRSTGTLGVQYAPARGWGGQVTANHVGRYFYDSAGLNALSASGYTTLDAGLTWRGQWGAHPVRARLVVTNLADKVYASNTFQIGGASLVAPGAPRAVQAGVQIDFK